MRKLKEVWLGQDTVNRVILIAGLLACIWSLIKGRGLYGVAILVLMGMLMVSRKSNREKRLSRLYGGLHFHMPDGEIYPVTLEQVRSEYAHGRKSRYNGRKVTIRFPYFCQDSSGALDTGFGLLIRADDRLKKPWKRGQLLAVTGYITAEGRDSFTIDRVEEIRLATAQEDLTVSASSPEQEDK